jgi:hypothetical protein
VISISHQELWDIAHKRAQYALAEIANNQMHTWVKYPSIDSPKEIIAKQIAEAMNDIIKGNYQKE